MSIETLTIGDPFFQVRIVKDEAAYPITGKTIALNLSPDPVRVREQTLGELHSVVLMDTEMRDVTHAVVIEGYADHPKLGDIVLYGKYSGNDIKIDGEEHKILREGDLLAKLEA